MAIYDCVFHNPKASQLYSNCRFVDEGVLHGISKILWNAFDQATEKLTHRTAALVDAGAGSGRLFIPMLRSRPMIFSRAVLVALDIAQPMLDVLADRIKGEGLSEAGPYLIKLWDMQNPYPRFDVPVAVVFSLATFHILRSWEQALENAVHILAQNGRFILIKEINQFMHQTEGFEGDFELETVNDLFSSFMREYHRLRSAFGLPFIPDGVLYSDFDPAVCALKNIGFELLEIIRGSELCWQKPHRYSEMLLMLKERVITTWGTDLPDKERNAIADKLRNWLFEHQVDMNATFNIPARFEIFIFGPPSQRPRQF
jgi:SAM-dependent methyltransferase